MTNQTLGGVTGDRRILTQYVQGDASPSRVQGVGSTVRTVATVYATDLGLHKVYHMARHDKIQPKTGMVNVNGIVFQSCSTKCQLFARVWYTYPLHTGVVSCIHLRLQSQSPQGQSSGRQPKIKDYPNYYTKICSFPRGDAGICRESNQHSPGQDTGGGAGNGEDGTAGGVDLDEGRGGGGC